MKESQHKTREEYLLAAVEKFKPLFERHGATIPAVHVSTGWPSSRAVSQKVKCLGECWKKTASADQVAQIFISPWLGDALDAQPGALDNPAGDGMGALPTLAHELIHAVDENKNGHKGPFAKLAKAIGLEGKMTSTHAGPMLREEIVKISKELGAYPHAKIDPTQSGKKKQGTRMGKCECPQCGYVCRTTKKWLDIGAPICPACKISMKAELPEGDAGDEDEGED